MTKKNLRLKSAMAEKDISQEQLATQIGITPGTLSRKINGQIKFWGKEIFKICEILEKNPSEIFF
jgi:DNA-binding Xre family transcriptional regulator